MFHYVIASSCGVRMWEADDLDHAKEQHNDCFKGDDTEVIEAAAPMEDLVRVAMLHGMIGPDGFTDKAREVEGEQKPLNLLDFSNAYLRDMRAEGAIEQDASDAVLNREAAKLMTLMYQLASSFVANEFSDRD